MQSPAPQPQQAVHAAVPPSAGRRDSSASQVRGNRSTHNASSNLSLQESFSSEGSEHSLPALPAEQPKAAAAPQQRVETAKAAPKQAPAPPPPVQVEPSSMSSFLSSSDDGLSPAMVTGRSAARMAPRASAALPNAAQRRSPGARNAIAESFISFSADDIDIDFRWVLTRLLHHGQRCFVSCSML